MRRPSAGERLRVVTVVGTRPEAVKLAPVIRELERRSERVESVVVSTGQHREMLAQVFDAFALRPDLDLGLMTEDQSLAGFAARALDGVAAALAEIRPDVVLVQGDTTTVAAAALACRYCRTRVGHVEAGLRSFDDENPFPEEINRRVASTLADYHFAPTEGARDNLLREGIDPARVHLTGNTVVDALRSVATDRPFEDARLRALPLSGRRLVLVTAHRRESRGGPLREVCEAVRILAERHPDVEVVYPFHPNPRVREVVEEALAGAVRVHLLGPVGYVDLLRLMDRAELILSDSGGIQEEAPSFDAPLLILRGVTERPAVLEVGAAALVGTERETIVRSASRLLEDDGARARMARAPNPFGDGRAAERIVAALLADRS